MRWTQPDEERAPKVPCSCGYFRASVRMWCWLERFDHEAIPGSNPHVRMGPCPPAPLPGESREAALARIAKERTAPDAAKEET